MLRYRSTLWVYIALGFCLTAVGCASSLQRASQSFYNGQPERTLAVLSDADDLRKKDRLLKLMEEGVAYHQLGQYENSSEVFLKAADLIDEQDKISITEQTASLVVNEWVTEYKGEYSERLWVHSYLMMNFLLLKRFESAVVEAKRALKVFDSFAEPLSDDHFSRALIALSFENLFEYNDAFIEYKKLADQMATGALVARELSRIASVLGMPEEAEKYRKQIPEHIVALSPEETESELILFLSTGRAPVKKSRNIIVPPGIRFSIPVYLKNEHVDVNLSVFDGERALPFSSIGTRVYEISRKSLEARRVAILAKETARVTSKEVMIRSLERGKDTELLGVAARVVSMIMEEADTRCWHTLPGTFGLIRIPISSGVHNFRIIISHTGNYNPREFHLPEMNVLPGRKSFYSIRLLN